MAYYAVTSESDELIPLSDLVFPTRIYFIVSDSNEGESVSFPIRYYDISNEIKSETFNLPFVYEMSGKYFYSFIQNAVASLQSEEETPTPTITPTIHNCATSPVTITVSSEYEASTNTRTHKYTTSDSNGNGGLFGCINVERGSTLTILVDGDQANLESHPIIITEFRNDGHHGTPRNDVTRIDLTEGQTEDHTYALTWVIPCDENINQYQYQCEHHSHMRGTINVTEECPTPTPEKTPTPEQTPTPTPEQTPTPTPEQTPTPTPEQTPTPTPEQTPTPTPEQTPTPTPEQTPTPTPEQTPTPTPEQTPTPTPLQPTPTPIEKEETPVKKILALHGGGEEPNSFRQQSGVVDLMNSLSDFEFVFADAPSNNVWMQDPPGGKSEPTTDSNWANDSIEYLDGLVSQHGSFFGILGYSQGAAFIPVYLANTSNTFDIALMYNGYLPTTHQGLINSINEVAPFEIPSVVFSGENDAGFKDMAPDLASKFEDSLYIRSSSAGHHLPIQSDSTFSQILSFIRNLELTTPTPEQPTPTPLQPTPTPLQPTPTPLQPTPTPDGPASDQNFDNESECVSGHTINNNEIYRGIQLKYSSGQIIVDAKEYTPSPSIPTLIYIYIGSAETANFCGRITVNSRVEGISNSTFNNTIISYVHSNGKCYNKDINGIIGNDNYIVFGEEDEETTNAVESCCSNLQVISSKSSNNYGIRLSDSDGMICVDPKNYTHSFGLPIVVYIYINNYTQYGETYRGKITFQNRLNGLTGDSFNSDNLIYIDSDNKCYNIKLSEVNELNNIKIFNTYN